MKRKVKKLPIVEGVLYAIQFDNGIKIGRSADFQNRLWTYSYPWCRPIIRHVTYNCNHTYKGEANLKKALKDFTVKYSQEFVTELSFEAVSRIVEKFAKDLEVT